MKLKNIVLCGVCLMVGTCCATAFAASGPRLVPDYDRDGVIDSFDFNRVEAGEQFIVYLNDDDDAWGTGEGANDGDTNNDLHDIPSGEDHARDCQDDEVNGRCDLLDFFPVLVDVRGVDDYQYLTWKLCGTGVNVVFTKLKEDNAGDFHTREIKAMDGWTSLYCAEVTKLTEQGVVLPGGFCDAGCGVFVFEGAATDDVKMMLCGYKSDGECVCSCQLNLVVKNVEEMYGWMNLRPGAEEVERRGGGGQWNGETSADNRHFILVHGYNTNHEEARGNAAEFYKKLWQYGFDGMFTAVEWRGDQSQVEYLFKNVSPNYFANVENAFLAAESFAEVCDKLPGEKILVGHGLGNVLVSSAIKDYGLDYTKYVMLNAEVAGKDFVTGGRFANLPRTINYYSPSDSFFAESALDVEECEIGVFNHAFGAALHKEAELWSLNEKIKKSSHAIELANGVITDIFDCSKADTITEEQLKYADVIESPAAGANPVATLENVDMEGFIGANEDWPLYEGGEGDAARTNVWNHSTFREVAFYHTSKLYASLAAVGKPRVIIDTDLGSCMDDLFTIDFAARMHREGKLDLLAVMMDRPDKSDPEGKGEFLKFADRYLASLGLGDLPIGTSMPLAEECPPQTEECPPQTVFNPYWTLIYSNNVTGVEALMPTNRTDAQLAECPSAVKLYRQLLNDAPDKSVTICSTGFLTNLKGLMESGPNYDEDGIADNGMELIAAKVKELRIMAGCFDPAVAPEETGGAEYNVVGDPVAAKKVFEQWPSPVVVSPWEVGLKLEYLPEAVLADFPAGTPDPVVRAAYTYWPEPKGEVMNRLWDPATVLPLTEGETLLPLSEMGGISVDEATGVTTFTADPSSNRCYQVASEMDAEAVMNRFREICRTGNAADTVVYGTIRTAEATDYVEGAIAIKDGKYVYVGDEAGAAAFVEDGVTKVVDHRGKGMVMPGCTDGHSHYSMAFAMPMMKGSVVFDTDDDKAAVLEKLEEAALAAQKAGKSCLYGFGWYFYKLRVEDGNNPTLAELDDATHGVSTVIFDSTGHNAYCNSECLKRCKIISEDGEAVLITEIDGGVLELDEKGYPTGFVNERVTGYLMRMGGIDYDEIVDDGVAEGAIRKTQGLLLSTGYTMALDGWSNQLHPSKFYEAAHCMDTNGELKLVFPMTYEVEPWQTNIDDEITYLDSLNKTYRTRHVLPEYLKVFMDGVVESKTGAIIKPYTDGTEYKSFWSVERLADITAACNAKGLTVHTHAMGDAAIRDVTDAYIYGGDGAHRNCLVHLRNVRTNEVNDFERMAANNIACTAGMTWHVGGIEALSEILDEEYVKHAYPIKSFFDAGIKVSSHSDYPANKPSPQDPFGIMEIAVTGEFVDPSTGERIPPFDTDELVTVEQAFQALTINGAWQLGLEKERGSIAVGKWADFVLADQDVFTCETNDIHKTKVVSTWFEGEKVYDASSTVQVTPDEPIVCDTAEEASNVLARAEFAPSAEVENKLGKGSDALKSYCNMFTLEVVPFGENQWAVAAYLNPPDWTNVVESARAATRQIPLADIAALPSGMPTNVTAKGCGVPGFYYSFYSGSTVMNIGAIAAEKGRNVLCGTDRDVKFEGVTKPSDAAGFFSIGVKEAPGVTPSDSIIVKQPKIPEIE